MPLGDHLTVVVVAPPSEHEAIRQALNRLGVEQGLAFEVSARRKPHFRSASEPTGLEVVVGVTGATLGVLITGLLGMASQRRSAILEVQCGSNSFRCPAEWLNDKNMERINALCEKMKAMDNPRVIIQ
jgi:hypothetical protein